MFLISIADILHTLMTIKNSDGSIYKLKKPNPLLKDQDVKEGTHIVHNLMPTDEIVVKYSNKKEVTQPVGAVIGVNTPHPVLAQQIPVPSSEVTLEPPVVTNTEPEVLDDPYLEQEQDDTRVSCWCLPGEFRKHYDKLYGETRQNVVWGEKFIVEGIILDSMETSFQIWTQILINPPSIIFVRFDKRWWRVNETRPYEGGYLMGCLPSDIRPRFD